MQVPGISMRNTRRIYLFPVYHMGRIYALKIYYIFGEFCLSANYNFFIVPAE